MGRCGRAHLERGGTALTQSREGVKRSVIDSSVRVIWARGFIGRATARSEPAYNIVSCAITWALLAEYLEPADHPSMCAFIGIERVASALMLPDTGNGIQDIQQAGAIASHA